MREKWGLTYRSQQVQGRKLNAAFFEILSGVIADIVDHFGVDLALKCAPD